MKCRRVPCSKLLGHVQQGAGGAVAVKTAVQGAGSQRAGASWGRRRCALSAAAGGSGGFGRRLSARVAAAQADRVPAVVCPMLWCAKAPRLAWAAAAAALVPAAAASAAAAQQQAAAAARRACPARACSWAARPRGPAACWRTWPRRRGWPRWTSRRGPWLRAGRPARTSSQVGVVGGHTGLVQPGAWVVW